MAKKMNRATNAGVNAITGFALQRNTALYLILNDYESKYKDNETRSHTDGFQRNNAKCLDEKGISRFVPHSSI